MRYHKPVTHYSRDQQYRYYHEEPGSAEKVCFILMNPTTNEEKSPTMQRVRGFANGRTLIVVNLFALMTPDVADLASHPDPVGPMNDHWTRTAIARATTIVAAWGSSELPATYLRAEHVRRFLRKRVVHCLGWTKQGEPKHPLRIPKVQQLVRYPLV